MTSQSVQERPGPSRELRAGRDHQAVHRDEFAHRRSALIAAALADDPRGGRRRASEALGAWSLLWYSPRMGHGDGRLRADDADICQLLGDLDRRSWRRLAGLLTTAGLLVAAADGGWQVPDCVRLRGSTRALASATAGFLWTDTGAYAGAVDRLRAHLTGRRAPLLALALLGTWETLRVLRVNYATAKARTSARLREEFGLSANTWDTHIGLLVAAGLLERPRRGLLAVPLTLWHGLQNRRRLPAPDPDQRRRPARKNRGQRRAKTGAPPQPQGVCFEGVKPPAPPAPPPGSPDPARQGSPDPTNSDLDASPTPAWKRARDRAPDHPALGVVLGALDAAYAEGYRVRHSPKTRQTLSAALATLAERHPTADHQAVAAEFAAELTRRPMTGVDHLAAVVRWRATGALDAVHRHRQRREHAAQRAAADRARDAAVVDHHRAHDARGATARADADRHDAISAAIGPDAHARITAAITTTDIATTASGRRFTARGSTRLIRGMIGAVYADHGHDPTAIAAYAATLPPAPRTAPDTTNPSPNQDQKRTEGTALSTP